MSSLNSNDLILIVEDEPEIAKILSEILTDENYRCMTLHNGLYGYEYIVKEHKNISLILSDISMPNLTGIQMLKKSMQEIGHVPTVLISAFSDFNFAQEALQLGVIDYLLKPFDIPTIIKKMPVWIELGKRLGNDRQKDGLPTSSKMETLLRISCASKS